MSKKILVAIAHGSEDIEAVTHIDMFRRASSEKSKVVVAKVDGSDKKDLGCKFANGTKVVADVHILSLPEDEVFDLIFVPGGLPGSNYCRDSKPLIKLMKKHHKANRLIAAICAAPVVVLAHHGFLDGKKSATSYPSFQKKLPKFIDDKEKKKRVTKDGNIITSQSPGTAMESALYIIKELFGKEKYEKLKKGVGATYA